MSVSSSGEKERIGQELALARNELSVLKQRETDILTQMEDLKHEKVFSFGNVLFVCLAFCFLIIYQRSEIVKK